MTSSSRASEERAARAAGWQPSAAPAEAHAWHAAGVGLAVVLSAFAWSTRFVAEYTLPKFFAIELGVGLAALGLFRAPAPAWRTPIDLAVGLNLVVLAFCSAFSVDWRTSLLGRYNSYSHGLWAAALYAAAALLAARLDRRSARQVALGILGAGALLAAYGVAQVLGYEPFLRAPLPAGNRAVSSIGSPVDLGAYLAALLPVAVAWFFGGSRLLGAAAFASIAAGLVATGSRGAWLGAFCGTAAYAGLVSRSSGTPLAERVRKAPGWAWAALAVVLLGAGWFGAKRLAARGTTSTDSSRLEVWRTAWRIFETRPLVGTGPDTFEIVFRTMRTEEFVRRMQGSTRFQAYAHNDLLQALSTTGILGTGAYLYLLFALVLAGLAACRGPDARLAAGVSGALAAVFVNVKFNPISFEVMTFVSVLCGLLVSLSRPESPPPASERAERAAAGAVALASLAGLFLILRFLAADLESKYAQAEFARGQRPSGMDHVRKALELDPCTTAYRVQQMNEMGEQINAEKTADARLRLLAEALELGKKAVACHPAEVNPHYLYGVAAWMHVQLGLEQHLELAERELDAALERDPLFIPLLEQRLAVANRRGGQAAQAWQARLARVRTLVPN